MRQSRRGRSANPPTRMSLSLSRKSLKILFVWIFLEFVANFPRVFAEERPQLTSFAPVGATIGQSSFINTNGSFKTWPVQVWCSNPLVIWKCLEEPGKFEVSVAENAQAGTVWVRFYNSAGASAAKRFLLSKAIQSLEKEPNNHIREATAIELTNDVHGVLEKNVDVDLFRISLQQGEAFSAVIDAARIGSPLDAHLQLLDERGFVVVETMDHFGLDPALSMVVSKSGTYFLRVFGFPIEPDSTISFRGGADWCYRLRTDRALVKWEPPADVVLPLLSEAAVSESIATAIPLEATIPRIGVMKAKGESHYFRLPASHGKTIQVRVFAQTMGSPMDPTITIVDKDGKQQVFLDDHQTNRDPQLTWQMPQQGDFYVAITDFHKQFSNEHGYAIMVDEVTPRAKLSITSDELKTKINEPLEISFSIERFANWDGDVELLVSQDNQESIKLEPSAFPVDKSKTTASIKLTATKPFTGVLPIRIRCAKSDIWSECAGPTPAGVWLSVTE